MENSAIDSSNQQNHPHHRQFSKNRSEYENLSDGDFDDDNSNNHNADHNPEHLNDLGKPKSSRGWRNVRAVMAYYYTLRKIKRNVCTIKINFCFLTNLNCLITKKHTKKQLIFFILKCFFVCFLMHLK